MTTAAAFGATFQLPGGADPDLEVVARFRHEGEPSTKRRPHFSRRGGRVIAYTPTDTHRAQAAITATCLASPATVNGSEDKESIYGIRAVFVTAKGQRRDVDNMLKLVMDAITGLVWKDDSQVIEVLARRVMTKTDAHTDVTVYRLGDRPIPYRKCVRCGTEFPWPPSHSKKMYCSGACRHAAVVEGRTRTCENCGGPYQGPVKQRFCGRQCKSEWGQVSLVCVWCQSPYTKPRSQNRAGLKLCSQDCRAAYWREHRKLAARGTCLDCAGPTSKATYIRCLTCSYVAKRHANRLEEL